MSKGRSDEHGGLGVADAPLLRLARGERGAVESCVDAYGPLVQSVATRLLPSPEDVEDGVQEVFVELWRSAPRFDPAKATDRGFVAMIARRRIIDLRRRADRRPATVRMTQTAERSSDEHERTLGKIEAGPAMEALASIADDRQRWILMAVVEGYSHSEIARKTGAPLGSVKSGIRRGLAEMRSVLEQSDMREVER